MGWGGGAPKMFGGAGLRHKVTFMGQKGNCEEREPARAQEGTCPEERGLGIFSEQL